MHVKVTRHIITEHTITVEVDDPTKAVQVAEDRPTSEWVNTNWGTTYQWGDSSAYQVQDGDVIRFEETH